MNRKEKLNEVSMQTMQHSGLKRNDKKTRKPFGFELIVGTMEYQLIQEILNCLNTK